MADQEPDDLGDIRCPLCERSPILGTYGFDEKGRLFIHIKVWKAKEVKADVYITGGEVTLKCYRCLRFNTVRIIKQRPVLSKTRRPNIGDGW